MQGLQITSKIAISFFRTFFNLLYHQLAWAYDAVAWMVSVGMWNDWVLSVTNDLDDSPILELGHGPGHLQVALNRRGKRVVGLDASWQMGRVAFKRLQGGVVAMGLVNGYAQKMPFARQAFPQVVATFPSEYIFDHATLQEISRVLVDDGEFICLPAAWIIGKSPLHRAAAMLFKITRQVPDTASDLEQRAKEMIEPHGFSVTVETRHLDHSVIQIIKCRKRGQYGSSNRG